MELYLNSILNLTDEEIENSKIEFNMQAGSGGQSFLDRWLKHSEQEKMSGTCADCSYWGWYGSKRNFYPGQWVFSFARMSDDEWLLISAAIIDSVPDEGWASVTILERYAPLFGRVIIKCKKGNTYSRYVFHLRKYIDQATVKEIFPCLYNGESFEGYDRVHLPFHRLSDIFEGKPVCHWASHCATSDLSSLSFQPIQAQSIKQSSATSRHAPCRHTNRGTRELTKQILSRIDFSDFDNIHNEATIHRRVTFPK